ncbi:hypothetical protein [Streptomyces sp. NE5-10]|uniref:hypothetical protein n=1 Tax=Streptomyces sp. NE5-10 TaxID=2759674 RepID=UPI001905817C|nr:hypothetical protein [Streptomyces sp. NE5-10]
MTDTHQGAGTGRSDRTDRSDRTEATRRSYDTVAADYQRLLAAAGLVEAARLVREPEAEDASPQGFVLARRPRTA